MTAAAWVKPTSIAVDQTIANRYTSTSDYIFSFKIDAGGDMNVVLTDDGILPASKNYIDPSASVSVGEWAFLAFTFAEDAVDGTLLMYKGTELLTEITPTKNRDTALPALPASSANLLIGASGSGTTYPLNSELGYFGMFGRALTKNELSDLMKLTRPMT